MINKKTSIILVFLLTLIFYLFTLSPSLAWGDGVKLQSDVILGESFIFSEMTGAEFTPDPYLFSKVGVAAWDHPLYIIMGNLFVRAFALADPLWLVNFISAIFGALSVALVYQLCYRFTQSIWASSYAAISLAVSHTFWWHSSTPEVYTLFVFLLLLSVYFYEKYEETSRSTFLFHSLIFLGLSASNHILAFLAIPAWGLYLFLSGRYRNIQFSVVRKIAFPFTGFLAGFSIYLIQFIRVSRSIPLGELMGPAVGSTFLSRLGSFSPLIFGESLLTYLLYLVYQFGPIGIVFSAVGIRRIFTGTDPSLKKIISLYFVFAVFGIFYRVTDQFAFFLTSYAFFAILMAIGATHIFSFLRGNSRFILTLVLVLTIVLTPLFYHAVPYLAARNGVDDSTLGIPQIGTGVRDGFAYYIDPFKRGDYNAHTFGSQTITNVAPNAIVLAEWYTDTDEYFVLRYFKKVEGLRPDVTIYGWPIQDPFSFDSGLALQVIEASFPEHPVYLASLSDKFYASSKLVEMFCIVPENNLYRLYPKNDGNRQCLDENSVTE